ncbi:hypothetical protein ACJX0J_009221, partial [Zea mays]
MNLHNIMDLKCISLYLTYFDTTCLQIEFSLTTWQIHYTVRDGHLLPNLSCKAVEQKGTVEVGGRRCHKPNTSSYQARLFSSSIIQLIDFTALITKMSGFLHHLTDRIEALEIQLLIMEHDNEDVKFSFLAFCDAYDDEAYMDLEMT